VCAARRHGRGGQPVFAWGGAVIGTLLGVFFGLALGGALPRSVADDCFGSKDDSTEK
jgi:hypothetical protein